MFVYPEEKLEAVMEVLAVKDSDVHVWSDNSITIGSNDMDEFFVYEGSVHNPYRELVGVASNGYHVYKQC
jgi:hypothetical protein